MAQQKFSIRISNGLVASAQQLYLVSRVGDERRGPNQSFEAYLSDLVAVALVERIEGATTLQDGLSATRKAPAGVQAARNREMAF